MKCLPHTKISVSKGMVLHDCDLRACLHAKRSFDAVGHYSRAEVLKP